MKHSYISGEYRVTFDWAVQSAKLKLQVDVMDPVTAVWLPLTPVLATNITRRDPSILDRAGSFVVREIRQAADSSAKLPDMEELALELRSDDVRFRADGPGGTSGAAPGV